MRKLYTAIVAFIAFALSASPILAQTGPKMSKNGGIGSSTSVYSGSPLELTGGTYSINGTTGEAFFKTVASSVQVSPGFCPYSQMTGLPANDNTACVQAAINFACTALNSPGGNVGGELVFGRGKYYLKGVSIPATCQGLNIRGQGFGQGDSGTLIVSDNTCTAPVMDFYPTATENYVYGGGVSDVYLYNNAISGGVFDGSTSCQQPLIRASYGRNMMFNNIRVLSPKIFIKVIGGNHNTVRDIAIDQALAESTGVFEFMGSGAAADATGQLTRQDGSNLDNVVVFGAPAGAGQQWYIGVWNHGFSQTLRINKAAFQSTSTALKVDCTNPGVAAPLLAASIDACPGNSYVYNLEGECAGANCIAIEDSYSWYFQTLYAACFARTNPANPSTSGCNNALHINNNQFTRTGTISVLGGQFNNAQASCVDIGGWQVTISGVNLYGCNAANVGGADVTIQAPGANLGGSNSIVNNRMCTSPSDGSNSEDGINIIAGSDYNTVSLNNFKGCGAGLIGTAGANSVVANNVGP